MPITTTKQVRRFTQDARFRSQDFLRECEAEPDYLLNMQHIHIQAPKHHPLTTQPDELIIPEQFSFGTLTRDQILSILNQVVAFAFDPLKVAAHLKHLDDALGAALSEHNISFKEQDILPTYLLAGRGHFIPGAAPITFRPKKKGRLLDSLLLTRENKRGVNKQGYTPKLIDFLSSSIVDRLVTSGILFSENNHLNRMLLHNSYSHRILAEAIGQAMEKGEIDLTIDGKKLTLPQLLEILVLVKTTSGCSLWENVMDSVEDTQYTSGEHPLDPETFNFSCRSPFVLSSLILCFGRELKLPNLQNYLLDSCFKITQQMIFRVKEKIAMQKEIFHYDELDISDERIHDRCMEYFSTMASHFGEVGGNTPFTADEKMILNDPRYRSTIWSPAIVRKVTPPNMPGEYASKISYLEEKGYLLTNGVFRNCAAQKERLPIKLHQKKRKYPFDLGEEAKDSTRETPDDHLPMTKKIKK